MSIEVPKTSNRTIRAIRSLYMSRFVLRAVHREIFEDIKKDCDTIMLHFREIGASVHVDDERGVAWYENDDEAIEGDVGTLGRRASLTPRQTVALIYLTERYYEFYNSGKIETATPLVTREEIREHLSGTFNHEKLDRKFEKEFEKEVMKDLLSHQLIIEIKGAHDTYEITPVCSKMLSAGDILSLIEKFKRWDAARKSGNLPSGDERDDTGSDDGDAPDEENSQGDEDAAASTEERA